MVHYWQDHQIRAWQQARIEKGKYTDRELSYLVVSEHSIEWEKSDEFLYQGYMYDLVSMYEQNGILHITALKDHKETENNRTYHREQKKAAESSSKQGVFHASVVPFEIPVSNINLHIPPHIELSALPELFPFTDNVCQILVPPPRA